MRIEIPDAVYRQSVAMSGGRGSKQMAILKAYLADKIPEGEAITRYEREAGTLYAVTE